MSNQQPEFLSKLRCETCENKDKVDLLRFINDDQIPGQPQFATKVNYLLCGNCLLKQDPAANQLINEYLIKAILLVGLGDPKSKPFAQDLFKLKCRYPILPKARDIKKYLVYHHIGEKVKNLEECSEALKKTSNEQFKDIHNLHEKIIKESQNIIDSEKAKLVLAHDRILSRFNLNYSPFAIMNLFKTDDPPVYNKIQDELTKHNQKIRSSEVEKDYLDYIRCRLSVADLKYQEKEAMQIYDNIKKQLYQLKRLTLSFYRNEVVQTVYNENAIIQNCIVYFKPPNQSNPVSVETIQSFDCKVEAVYCEFELLDFSDDQDLIQNADQQLTVYLKDSQTQGKLNLRELHLQQNKVYSYTIYTSERTHIFSEVQNNQKYLKATEVERVKLIQTVDSKLFDKDIIESLDKVTFPELWQLVFQSKKEMALRIRQLSTKQPDFGQNVNASTGYMYQSDQKAFSQSNYTKQQQMGNQSNNPNQQQMGMQSNNQNLSEQNPETSIYDNLLQSNIKK